MGHGANTVSTSFASTLFISFPSFCLFFKINLYIYLFYLNIGSRKKEDKKSRHYLQTPREKERIGDEGSHLASSGKLVTKTSLKTKVSQKVLPQKIVIPKVRKYTIFTKRYAANNTIVRHSPTVSGRKF